MGDLQRSSVEEIRALAARVMSSTVIRQNVERMQRTFVESAGDAPVRVLFDRLLHDAKGGFPCTSVADFFF
jgi:hypothetical protein